MTDISSEMTMEEEEFVERVALSMIQALCEAAEIGEVSVAYALQQISTKFLCQFDQAATAAILQASADHAKREIDQLEFHRRCHGPFDQICAAYDRADAPLN